MAISRDHDLSHLAGRPVVIGAGLAGLMTALHLAPCPVVVLSPAPLGLEASSAWAQGGIAASVGPDDWAELHVGDLPQEQEPEVWPVLARWGLRAKQLVASDERDHPDAVVKE